MPLKTSPFKGASLLTSLQDHCIGKIFQTFYGSELFHHETFSGHDVLEERLLTYWGHSSLKHSCDNWGAALCCGSAALANPSQPRGSTSENIRNNFLKCQIWKRTITMSTYSLRLTLSEVLFQQGPLMFCPIQGTVITLSAAVGDFFISSFSAHWRGSSAEVQLHCTAQWAQILSSPPCAARAQAAKAVPQVHYLSQSRVSSENSPPGRQLVALRTRTCIISPWRGGPLDMLLLLFPATRKF